MSGLLVKGQVVSTEFGTGWVEYSSTRCAFIHLVGEQADMINVVTGTPGYERVKVHQEYPHWLGRLPGCPACEAYCHCKPGETECVFEGRHKQVNQPENGAGA